MKSVGMLVVAGPCNTCCFLRYLNVHSIVAVLAV
jgi:hypothetical protein